MGTCRQSQYQSQPQLQPQLQPQPEHSIHQSIQAPTQKTNEVICDQYDNPQRAHLSSNFLNTNIDASNRLLQNFDQRKGISGFWMDTLAESSFKQAKDETSTKNKLPSVKICYGDFVSFSEKKIENRYTVIQKIGAGSYGDVFKVKHQSSGDIRAVKVIRKSEIEKYKQQIQILKECDHPSIIQIYQVFECEHFVHVVMEYCQGGSMIQLIKNKKYDYVEQEARSIVQQILRALIYLNDKGIVHRDIKLENIVFMQPRHGDRITSNLKIIDFGSATKLKYKVNRAYSICGTTLYMPPQSFSGWYTKAFDIWSCGVIMFVLLIGNNPFKRSSKQETIKAIKQFQLDYEDERWASISPQAKQLIKKMLNRDFMKRATAQECLKSTWFQPNFRRSAYRKASERFKNNLSKYYAINNFVSIIESYLAFVKLSQSQHYQIRKQFKAIDIKKRGTLLKNDLVDYYRNQFSDQASKIQELIQAIDKNKSGSIDYSEFKVAMSDKQKLFIKESLCSAFDHFDLDGSGFIEQNQLLGCLKQCETDVESLILQIDRDKDRKISKGQFIQYFEKLQQKFADL